MYLAEHFVRAPDWKWYILLYFFLAGLSAGCYVLGSMLRFLGRPADAPAARIAFLMAFPLLVLCPILLTVDLGQPVKFWHMIWDTGQGGINFKYYSPMSLGVWGLTLYGGFCFLSFVEVVWAPAARILGGILGRLVNILGSIFGLFICTYTGVLLSVSNQPVWSDGWPLGGLFLASALSGAAALLLLARRFRPELSPSVDRIADADRYFVILEVVLIAVFLITVAAAGTVARLFGGAYLLLWLIVVVGVAAPLAVHYRWPGARNLPVAMTSVLVLAGVLALRAVVIFGAQS
ncbi:MAG: polysulfide reductase NrfD [Candidatus Dormibacteraceae bacterium]